MIYRYSVLSADSVVRFELRAHVRRLGRTPSTAQKLELANKRRKLRNLIISFSKEGLQHLGEDYIDSIYETEQVVLEQDISYEEDEDLTWNPTISEADPEHQVLPFPSAVPEPYINELPADRQDHIASLRTIEFSIRQGHGDDALDQVRDAVIHLSWQFKNKVRTAQSVATKTRAWDKVKLLNGIWNLQRRIYNHNRIVMMRIGDRTAIALQYPFLELEDCKISTKISNPNSAGQSSDRLPWFWSSSSRVAETDRTENDYQNECT